MRYSNHFPAINRQQGAALVTGLLILLVLTLIGITGMSTTTLQERMSGNERNRQIAFQAAEAALRDAETFVAITPLSAGSFTNACTGGLCTPLTTGSTDRWQDSSTWSDANKHRVYNISGAGIAEVKSPPKYIIEDLGKQIIPPETSGTCAATPSPCPNMYRITALGTGATDTARVMLQSIFKKNP